MAEPSTVNLYPHLVNNGESHKLAESGRRLSATFSPKDNQLAAFLSPAVDPEALKGMSGNVLMSTEKDIYMAAGNKLPDAARRTFLTDASVIFSSLQSYMAQSKEKKQTVLTDLENQEVITKLTIDYMYNARDAWLYCTHLEANGVEPQYDAEHYRVLYTTISLFITLYLPGVGEDRAPVGDELMAWLNLHFIEPSSDEGDELSSQEKPWEDENFWSYLTRAVIRGLSKSSVFFLDVLSKRHPSEDLQSLSVHLSEVLTTRPSLLMSKNQREYVIAARRWGDNVKALRFTLDRVPEDARHDGFDNWWEQFSDIVGLLEGRADILLRVCTELGSDWKEVCVAWGIFVNARLQRSDMADVAELVMEQMPFDPTDLEDAMHAALFRGKPIDALPLAAQHDPWLSAHIADVLEKLGLIDADIDDESELTPRQHYILQFADYLHSDPSLWRITVDYMCSCGDIGKKRADQVLLRVPISLAAARPPRQGGDRQQTAMIVDGDGGEVSTRMEGVLKEVIKACYEYERDEARRMVCSLAAKLFLKDREYGLAIEYIAAAEDWAGLGHIVDSVLEEYVLHGPEHFARSVATVAPSLHDLRSAYPTVNGVFIHRLTFAVRYAEFHRQRLGGDLQDAALDLVALFQEEIAPRGWWGVLLLDATELLKADDLMLFSSSGATELLKRLEELHTRVTQGGGEDYLSALLKTMKGNGGEREALQKLMSTRLALANYYARCTTAGVGVGGVEGWIQVGEGSGTSYGAGAVQAFSM